MEPTLEVQEMMFETSYYQTVQKQIADLANQECSTFSLRKQWLDDIQSVIKSINEQIKNTKSNNIQPQSVIQCEEFKKHEQEPTNNIDQEIKQLLNQLSVQLQSIIQAIQNQTQKQHQIMIVQTYTIQLLEHLLKVQKLLESQDHTYHDVSQNKLASQAIIHRPLLNDKKCVMFDDFQEIQSYNDEGNEHYTIIQCQNGKYLVGGNHLSARLLDSQLQLVKELKTVLWRAIAFGNCIYCKHKAKNIAVIDQSTFEIKQIIEIREMVYKFLVIEDDYLLICQNNGFLDVIQLSNNNIVLSHRFKSQAAISDIIHINGNKYAFATSGGVMFGTFTVKPDMSITFKEEQEMYLKYRDVICIEKINDEYLIVGELDSQVEFNQLQMINIKKKYVKKLYNAGEYKTFSLIQRVLGYCYDKFPFVIVKDTTKVAIVNIRSFQIHSFIDCPYGAIYKNSLLQIKTKDKLQVITFQHDRASSRRSVNKYSIAQLK